MSIPGPAEVVVEALGVPIAIRGDEAHVARLRRQWSRALTDRPAEVVIETTDLAADDEDAGDYAITTRVTMAALEATAGTRLNLHAGAVADTRGRALAIIGPSGSGKTTAIILLARRLGYLTDETVSVDASLAIHPHAKPLSVITDVDAPLVKHSAPPDELGLLRPPDASHLHRIVVLHRGDEDAGLVPLAPALAIAQIAEQTSSLVMLEHPVRRLADAIDACGGAWELRYREVEDRVGDLVGLMSAPGRPAPERVHHPWSGGASSEPVAGAWSRVPWHDAVEYADELVLMVGDGVHVLAGLGIVLWLALHAPRTDAELVAEVTALWGEHSDAARLVADALDVLTGQGLVRRPG